MDTAITYSYFPGCTLKNKATDLEVYALKSAEQLGFKLEEIEDWVCCGGVYPVNKNETGAKLSSIRSLHSAHKKNQDLVTLCSACYNVLKLVNNDMQTNDAIISKANNYLAAEEIEYHGETKVLHYLEILRDVIGFDKVKAAVEKANGGSLKNSPYAGKKIGAYYGCLLLRPGKILKFDDAENPEIIENFIRAIGGEPVIYAQRNECCGAYTMLEDKSIPERRSKAVITNAAEMGAEMLVTSCPLCRYNLIKNNDSSGMEIVYFTEMLAKALGIKD